MSESGRVEWRDGLVRVEDFSVGYGITTTNEAAVGIFLRFEAGDPKRAYALRPDEARELAAMLVDCADRVDAQQSN
jgi:hypothetical protein